MTHDVFICHASEDKEAVARPLAGALRDHNVDVWYDEFSLTVGDSLREAIDRGLTSCRYAIVIISPDFFTKPWANRELNGIVARETARGERLILPLWHNVGVEEVLKFSPPLADIRAVSSSIGIDKVASVLLQIIHLDHQPLPVARAELERFGWEPPPFSDEWWLNMVTLANDIEFGMFSSAFQFPARHQNAQTGQQRGENIAWAALQSGWWNDAEEKKICQITHPEDVVDFIHNIPELYEVCKLNPGHLAGYVPQLLIPMFSAEFAESFDDLLTKSEHDFRSSPRSHSDEGALCDARLALRHPTFGNHRPSRIVDKWLHGLKGSYSAERLPRIDYLFWLLSDDCSWMPDQITQVLIKGMQETPHWWLDIGQFKMPNRRENEFYTRRKVSLKWTKPLIADLVTVAEESSQRNNLQTDPKKIAARFIEHDMVGSLDRWHEQLKARKRPG